MSKVKHVIGLDVISVFTNFKTYKFYNENVEV